MAKKLSTQKPTEKPKKEAKASSNSKNWVVAKASDGTIQITYTIAYSLIKKEEDKTIEEYKSKVAVPGFRKGMAPASKVRAQIPQNELVEHTLSHILPGFW